MPVPSDPFTFTAGTTASATQVNQRFNVLYNLLNNGLDDANFADSMLKLQVAADRHVALGSASLNFPSRSYSDLLTVTHGLPSTPVVLLGSALLPSNLAQHAIAIGFNNVGSTTFQIAGNLASGTALGPGTVTAYWLAIS